MTTILKNRIFNLAILVSLIWHIFWLSMIKVIVIPKETKPIKFTKVSFLGPILEKGAFDIRIGSRERSSLEKRYLADVQKADYYKESRRARGDELMDSYVKKDPGKGFYQSSDRQLADLIEDAVSGAKIEPFFTEEG